MNGITVRSPEEWKGAMKAHLKSNGMSRYAFIRRCCSEGLFSVHTGECLLADEGCVTARRIPNLRTALDMASLAGFEIVLVARRAPSGLTPAVSEATV